MNNFNINNINYSFGDCISQFRSEYNNINSIIKTCEKASTPKEASIMIHLLMYKITDMMTNCLDVYRVAEQTLKVILDNRALLSEEELTEVERAAATHQAMTNVRRTPDADLPPVLRGKPFLNALADVRNFPQWKKVLEREEATARHLGTWSDEQPDRPIFRTMRGSGKTKRRRIRRKKPYFNPNPNSNPTKKRRTKKR